MLTHSFHRLLLSFVGCCFIAVLAACGPGPSASVNAIELSMSTSQEQASTGATSKATVPMPPTQTSCPAQGQARAALTSPLTLASHQNVVYVYNTSTTAFLRRYDVTTGQKTTIVSLSSVKISDAQVSTDGHYVLFVSQVSGRPAIQMIRMDGQGLQTLYCPTNGRPPSLSDLLWSPNQQLAVFLEPNPNGGPAGPDIRLLNLTAGTVQTEVIGGLHSHYILETWRNNTQVYFTVYTPPATPPQNNVYVLDLTKGPNSNNTKEVAQIDGDGWDMNLTPDGNTLVLSQDAPNSQPPSLISSQPATGGVLKVIYVSHAHAVTQGRIASATTLLFILGSQFSADPQAGLWKINLDGSGLTPLAKDGRFLSANHTTWSSVSRDGKLYAVGGYELVGSGNQFPVKLFYGSLSGGAATQFAITNAGEEAQIAGWTTM